MKYYPAWGWEKQKNFECWVSLLFRFSKYNVWSCYRFPFAIFLSRLILDIKPNIEAIYTTIVKFHIFSCDTTDSLTLKITFLYRILANISSILLILWFLCLTKLCSNMFLHIQTLDSFISQFNNTLDCHYF